MTENVYYFLSNLVSGSHKKQKPQSLSRRSQSRVRYKKCDESDQNKHEPLIHNGEVQHPSSKVLENGVPKLEDITVEIKDSSWAGSDKWLGVFLWKVCCRNSVSFILKDFTIGACLCMFTVMSNRT